jgi:nucleoside-diphosphate-sugar epimerase
MPSYLVTGGAGFIGSHLAEALVKKGAGVTIVDNLYSGRIENIRTFADRVTFIRGDIRDAATLERALEGVEAVLHEAAIPSVAKSFETPAESLAVNLAGTAALLEACRKKGVGKVIFASSSSVYGETPKLPKEESMDPVPKSPYALSKLSCERLLQIYSQIYGMETASLRYFNVFGPRQDPDSEYAAVIPKFITSILRRQSPVIFGDGLQSRDFCHIQNVVRANLLCLEARGLQGEIMNVACGERIDLLELVRILGELTGSRIEPRFGPERPGDVKHSLASIERAAALIGYRVEVPLRKGLEMTISYFKNDMKC